MKPTLLAKILAGLALAFTVTGCVAPRISAPRASELLWAKAGREKIPIRSFKITSTDRPLETEHDVRMLTGTSRFVLYPKQAREFVEQDLRDYVDATFTVDPASDVVLSLTIVQAHNYFTMVSSGSNLIPFVGAVTAVTDSFRDFPFTFIVEVDAEARTSSPGTATTNVFVKNVEITTSAWETKETQDNRYRKQLADVRTELFERLDRQLLPMWRDQRFVGKEVEIPPGDAATLASELSQLDASLAEGKITREEHTSLTKAATERHRR
jgi:hypothetical protein